MKKTVTVSWDNPTMDSRASTILAQLTRNQAPPSGLNSSKYLGVYQVGNRWRATIYCRQSGTLLRLGCFKIEQAAAKAYDEAAQILNGKKAKA